MTRRLGLIAVIAVSVIRVVAVSAPIRTAGPRGWWRTNGARSRRSPAKTGAPCSGCPQRVRRTCPNFVGRIDCRLKGSLPGTGPHGNAGHLFLRAARDDGERAASGSAGRHHGMVPTARRIVPNDTINDAFRRRDRLDEREGRARRAATSSASSASKNHYYVARETDAAPLQVGAERERFLFYRGVGRIPPPIAATCHARRTDRRQPYTRRRARRHHPVRESRWCDGLSRRSRRRGLARHSMRSSPKAKARRRRCISRRCSSRTASIREKRRRWSRAGAARGSSRARGSSTSSRTRPSTRCLPLQIDPQPVEVKRVFVGRLEIATPSDAERSEGRAGERRYGEAGAVRTLSRADREAIDGASEASVA